MVKEGQVIILDSGTTTSAIARALRSFQNLTIITNAVNIAAELRELPVEVILTGGLAQEFVFAVGPIAEETLARLELPIFCFSRRRLRRSLRVSTPQSPRSQATAMSRWRNTPSQSAIPANLDAAVFL